MALHQSRVLNNLHKFRRAGTDSYMREFLDCFLLWKTIEFFKPNTLLEIGCYAGQTLGLMIESAGAANIDSVDVTYRHRSPFDELFPNATVTWHEIDSKDLVLTKVYDFIHIDGDHSYESVLFDINNCLPALSENSVLSIDDYKLPEVNLAIQQCLLEEYNFVPFLKGDQQLFFHHRGHRADEFLDTWIQNNSRNFIYFNNVEYHGHTVLEAKLPNIFVDNRQMFIEACKFYNL